MADGIKVVIAPSTITSGAGRRLAETSPSFASDKFTGGGQRYTAPGVGPRDEIAALKKVAEGQTQLVAELKLVRAAMRQTALNTGVQSPEYQALTARASEIYRLQNTNVSALASGSVLGEGAASRGTAPMPGSVARGAATVYSGRGVAGSLINAGSAAWSGDVTGTLGHLGEASMIKRGAGWAWGGVKNLFGYGAEAGEAGEAVAGGVAAEGAEAAGAGALGAVGWPAVGIGAAALGAYGVAKYFNRDSSPGGGALGGLVRGAVDTALSGPQDLLTLAAARRYGSQEEPRQARAYEFARSFGESGQSMIGATTNSRWSALGITPDEAVDITGTMRTIGGSQVISNAAAFKGARAGTFMGLTGEQIGQVGGAAARLGVDPEESIRIISQGVAEGNQKGRGFEIASASLDYLKTIAGRAAISGETGLSAISNLSAILARSGIPGFAGGAAVSAISGIEAAHSSDDFYGVKALGAAFSQFGEAQMLRGAGGNIAKAEEIRQGGFGGRYGKIYGASIHSEIAMARGLGPLGMEALEETWNMPIGSYIDPRTGRLTSVNSALDDLDQAIQSGDYLTAAKIQNDLLASGARNISPMAVAQAGHAAGIALTGEAASKSYAAGERLESAGLSLLRRNINDRSTASALDYLSSTLGPTPPSKTPGISYLPEPALPPGGLPTPFATPGAFPTPGAPAYAATAAGVPIAGAGLLGGLGDSVNGAVILLAGILERILAAIESGGGTPGAPSAAPNAMPTPAIGHLGPTASTPKSSRH